MLSERSRDNLQRISLYSGTEFLINYLFPEKIGFVKRIWTYQGYHAQGVETQWNFRLRKNKKNYCDGKYYFPEEHQLLQVINQLEKEKKEAYFDQKYRPKDKN